MKKYLLLLALALALPGSAMAQQPPQENVALSISKADFNVIVQALFGVRYDMAAPVLERLNEQVKPKAKPHAAQKDEAEKPKE